MALILKKIFTNYHYTFEELADKRVIELDLFLMSSPIKPVLLIAAYFYFIYNLGPRLMKDRKPFELKWVLRIFNLFQILSNTFIVARASHVIWNHMNWSCEKIDYSNNPHAVWLLKTYHLFFLTKAMDMLDTVFFVLRKRYHQVTFLHVYHHFGMLVLMWMTVKFFGGGYGTWVGLINGSVHAIMYVYYFLSSLDEKWKRSIWFKKLITQIQMVQFLTFSLIYGRLLFNDCEYPKLLSYFFVPQNFFMLLLFSNFYQKAYVEKKRG